MLDGLLGARFEQHRSVGLRQHGGGGAAAGAHEERVSLTLPRAKSHAAIRRGAANGYSATATLKEAATEVTQSNSLGLVVLEQCEQEQVGNIAERLCAWNKRNPSWELLNSAATSVHSRHNRTDSDLASSKLRGNREGYKRTPAGGEDKQLKKLPNFLLRFRYLRALKSGSEAKSRSLFIAVTHDKLSVRPGLRERKTNYDLAGCVCYTTQRLSL